METPPTVNKQKNEQMNKSAILFNKWEQELAQDLPRYVTSSRRNSKMKTVNINKGLMSQGVKSKTIYRLLEASIKEALKLQGGNGAKSSKYIAKAKTRQVTKPYPRRILNILYRQNIKNYNPYVAALTELESLTITQDEKDQIRKLCYIGIARNYFQMRKYFTLPSYSRVGILIRTYMVDVMKGHLEKKIENQPQSVYIKINQTALSFNSRDRPKELEELISRKKYSQVIEGVNKIIVREYEKYKKGNFEFINTNYTYSQLVLYTLVAIIILCIIVWSPQSSQNFLAYIAFASVLAVISGGMGFAWLECKSKIAQVCAPRNITGVIEERLREYLGRESNDTLTWRVGPDFYWIQIENVKIKKRRLQESPDIF